MARTGRKPSWRAPFRRIAMATENALELARLGHFTEPEHAPYKVVHQIRIARLRRYGGDDHHPTVEAPLLLIPPLMVTADIYDVAPDISGVTALTKLGLDVWVIDFGSPEQEEGGMKRTLDDHITAVNDSIDWLRDATGHDVHLVGYSQGGMFAYQLAAYRASEGIASLVTFGSPVDIHRALPKIDDTIAGRLFELAQGALDKPIDKLEGLPGFLTSTGFKLLAANKEVSQLMDFIRKLHDRQALEKREARRRFLGGEGFVAWPGPALKKFIDEFVVHNRMLSGGFVVAGRTVTLADITCPVMFFVGERDTIANESAVRAIRGAAPNAELFEVSMRAGHFGLVVGSQAVSFAWPTVASWVRWREGVGPEPSVLQAPPPLEEPEEAEFDEVDFDVELFYQTILGAVGAWWQRVGRSATDLGEQLDSLRWQVPRLSVLQQMQPDTRVSLGLALSEQAASNPEGTFFLWEGRAFSYAQTDRRVDSIVRGLIRCGVRRGEPVAVLMGPRPSYLSVTAALSRLGAVPILLSPGRSRATLEEAIHGSAARFVIADPESAALGKELFDEVLVLGGAREERALPSGVVDMELIDPDTVDLPGWYEPNPGCARDLALIILTAGRGKKPRAAKITNQRWAFSAYGAAAACTLSPRDTVYCCLPLHHPAGMLVTVGGGLVGGSRLALATRFDPDAFWDDVRRYGATVVFYAGDMLRELLRAEPSAADNENPIRLFAGSGVRADVWQRIVDRFGPVGILEFYASTEGNAVLANASGEKVGALGRPLPGSAEVALVRYDFSAEEFLRDDHGLLIRCEAGEPGVLLARLDADHPLASFTGGDEAGRRLLQGVFEANDTWFITWDVLRHDGDGDFWFVDRVSRMLRTAAGIVATRSIEDALYGFPALRHTVVYGVERDGVDVPVAVVVTHGNRGLDLEAWNEFAAELDPGERPGWVKRVERIPMTDGFRPDKAALESDPLDAGAELFTYDEETKEYRAA
ncbi:MAG: alpha/beta fold hydrolase [Deltaproteobacteria bacterium]|nr:alpha/beta fold hydrolase [Deltaproteobacteria bacterium]